MNRVVHPREVNGRPQDGEYLSDSFDNNSIGFALWIRQNAYGGNPCGYGDFPIDPSLRPFLSLIWVFESTVGKPPNDLHIIAPDGEMKLIIPFHNCVTSRYGGALRVHAVSTCSIVGQQTLPAVIDSPEVTGIIGITVKRPAPTIFSLLRFMNLPTEPSSLTRSSKEEAMNSTSRLMGRSQWTRRSVSCSAFCCVCSGRTVEKNQWSTGCSI